MRAGSPRCVAKMVSGRLKVALTESWQAATGLNGDRSGGRHHRPSLRFESSPPTLRLPKCRGAHRVPASVDALTVTHDSKLPTIVLFGGDFEDIPTSSSGHGPKCFRRVTCKLEASREWREDAAHSDPVGNPPARRHRGLYRGPVPQCRRRYGKNATGCCVDRLGRIGIRRQWQSYVRCVLFRRP
jgi:hypothetical protein